MRRHAAFSLLQSLRDEQGAADRFWFRIDARAATRAALTELFAEKVLSVSELTQQVKFLLEEAFPTITLAGEISGLSRPASGHVYLTLKDANAQGFLR